jgi:glyoxylate reductase
VPSPTQVHCTFPPQERARTLLESQHFVLDVNEGRVPQPRGRFLERVAEADGLFCSLFDMIDEELLAHAPRLRVIAQFGVGYDNVDVGAVRKRGLTLTNTPNVLTDATADLAWALLLSAARRVGEGERLVRRGEWPGWKPGQLLGAQVSGSTLGIVGGGRIGTATGLRARGFGMRVLYASRSSNATLETEVGAKRVELETLLRESDFVSLHVALTPETRHLLNAERLSLMKPTAVLVNTARGAVVDEAALAEALRSGRLAAAGLDVYEHEPKIHPDLLELENVVLAPHLGSATHTTREAMGVLAARNLIAGLRGETPPTPILIRGETP